MEEDKKIPIMDNMPEDVKAIVDYLNAHNITFDDYKGDTDNFDDVEDDEPFYNGEYIEYSPEEDSDDTLDVGENAEDKESLSDLNEMF